MLQEIIERRIETSGSRLRTPEGYAKFIRQCYSPNYILVLVGIALATYFAFDHMKAEAVISVCAVSLSSLIYEIIKHRLNKETADQAIAQYNEKWLAREKNPTQYEKDHVLTKTPLQYAAFCRRREQSNDLIACLPLAIVLVTSILQNQYLLSSIILAMLAFGIAYTLAFQKALRTITERQIADYTKRWHDAFGE